LASRYELIEPIGSGGMAEVHRAWDTLLRRHVAVKLFQPNLDPAAAQRFDNEVRALAALSHPGLVAVYDADTTAETPFVVLQLIEGSTLRERVAGGPLPVDRVRRFGAVLADALAHVHSRGLVHRDVKPSNILLDGEDNAYLADFGLVHLTGATRLTRTDHLVGTAAYLAPEQVLGGDVDHPTDVYALGLVLLECLTGHREYAGGDVEAAIARLHRPPVVPEHVPADLKQLLVRMTATAPEDRPAAEDCAQVLAVAALPAPGDTAVTDSAAAGTAAAGTAATEVIAPRRGPRIPHKTLVASVGVLFGAMAITTAATSGQEPATSPAPPAVSAQAVSPAPQEPQGVSQDAPVRPQQLMATQEATGGPEATTTAPPVTTSAPAPAPTGQPVVVEPSGGPTTVTAPVTTGVQPSSPVAPTSEPGGSPEPTEPTSPVESGGPGEGSGQGEAGQGGQD
jgi:tRNA A-37 threonylcarbamoyl transferase component Bud32